MNNTFAAKSVQTRDPIPEVKSERSPKYASTDVMTSSFDEKPLPCIHFLVQEASVSCWEQIWSFNGSKRLQ